MQMPTEVVTTGEGEGRYYAVEGQEEEYLQKLHQLTQAEMDMLSRITELERKETAYMQTLQQADELWSELEGGYQRQLHALRANEAELRARLEAAESAQRQRHRAEHDVNELEQAVSELSVALRRAEEERASLAAKVAQLSEALAVADGAVERLTHEVERELRPRLSQERRLTAELQRELAHRGHAYENMQDSYEAEVEKLKCQLAAAKKECLAVNNECYHLKAEVQELKNTIQELRTCMAKQKSDDEKTLVHLTNLLAEKDRELQGIVQASQDVMMRSAHDEIEEAEAEAAQSLPLETDGCMHPSNSVSTVAELMLANNQDDSGIGLADDGSSHVGHISMMTTSHSEVLMLDVYDMEFPLKFIHNQQK
ncbi:uncharacterized protein GBIM_06908 [Gryllus bimaculatus]|nr:uncharacterized protein GBIM_06908 [Gryllus bimaculatus]